MMTEQEHFLIKILSDGQFHSGAALGEKMGLSRAGVWKNINRLSDYGIECQRLHGQGYCIPGGIEFLDKSFVRNALHPDVKTIIKSMDFHLSLPSTNQSLMEQVKHGEPPVLVSVAEHQRSGQGRRGRSWLSPFGKNIYLSLSWSFLNGPSVTQGLTLAIGVGLVQVLKHFGAQNIGLKWPNDILWQGKKLAGVLTQMHIDSLGVCHVVIGVGINVDLTEKVKNEINQGSVDLFQILGKKISRNELVAALLNHLIPLVSEFTKEGFSPFMKHWEHYDVLKNERITLHLMENKISGTALGIDDSGGLQVQQKDRIMVYRAGEVSIRSYGECHEFID